MTPQQFEILLTRVCSVESPSLGPWLALFGTILTVTVAAVTIILNKSQKNQEILLKSLEFLVGGTQKRAVGIALARELGNSSKLRQVIVPVLQTQYCYISTKAVSKDMEPKEKAVEDLNLENIGNILTEWGASKPPSSA